MPRALPLVAAILVFLIPSSARGTEVLCDPAHQDCRTMLLNYIQNERVGIDVAMWFMEDTGMADALIARFNAGVRVRALVDPRRSETTPMNAVVLDMLSAAGIPIRHKNAGGILHWKFMIFDEQNAVQFSAANYSDYYFRPAVPYRDYTDEGIYFGDDPPLVDSFRRKFDDSWIDTVNFANYANITSAPVRAYPLYPNDPSMNWVPWEDFGVRSRPYYDAEDIKIDVIMYKITDPSHADGLIRAFRRGVPVRVIAEPSHYRNANNVWQAYNIDRLYAAGVLVRDRAHAGFNHQKSTLLYGQGVTVFGSSNWTNDSNRVQYEHNYFTRKVWFFNWFRDQFERKWNNSTGNAETKPFVPLPPDVPVYSAPANGATGVSTSSTVSLSWRPGLWAHRADVYFGTSSNPPLFASNVSVSPNTTKNFALPALTAGTTYYWRIVSKTMAERTASGPVSSFTTAGGTGPPPPPPPDGTTGEVVLYAADATTFAGAWRAEADTTAAGGQRMRHPDAGAAKITAPLATPVNYFELTFTAQAGRAYRLWIRGKADGNLWSNDSVHVQFSGSVNASGTPVYRIGSTTSTEYNLESCGGCGLAGWGWEDNGWGTAVLGPTIYFAASGTQRIRIQTREDGLSIDQIVLSPQTYLTASPGATKNDTRILPRSGGSVSTPPPSSSATEIVLYASEATITGTGWRVEADTTAAGGRRIWNPNANAAKLDVALAAPASYIEMTFTAEAGRPYRLWMRGKAEGNAYANDSVHVQFSGSVTSSGTNAFRIGSTASAVFNLESCGGCGLAGWGWEDNGWGTGVLGPLIYFATTGTQRIRIQTREDGLSIDQIVLSAQRYLTSAPGPAKNDTTVLPK